MSVRIFFQKHPQLIVLKVTGELDVESSPQLRQVVTTALADGARQVVLDLSDTSFIDSFGIGVIVGALKRVRQRGGDLQLVRPVTRVWRVLEICGLDRIIESSDSLNDLLRDLNENKV